jgi:hypothetical protein
VTIRPLAKSFPSRIIYLSIVFDRIDNPEAVAPPKGKRLAAALPHIERLAVFRALSVMNDL